MTLIGDGDQIRHPSIDDVIREVKAKAEGRTRYEGQPPHWDVLLVAEIEKLRCLLWDLAQWGGDDVYQTVQDEAGIDPAEPCPVCEKVPLIDQTGN